METRSEALRLLSSVAALALLAFAPNACAQSVPTPERQAGDAAEPVAAEPAQPPAMPPEAEPAWVESFAFAQRTPGKQARKLGVVLRLGLDFGGDVLGTATWSDTGRTEDLRAGQFMTFAMGVFYHPHAPWALEATAGYKLEGAGGSNGSATFMRVPLDVIASFALGRHRLGVGPTVHLIPTFSCNATGGCGPTTFEEHYDTAIGLIAQYAYGIPFGASHGLDLVIRYTAIEYEGAGLLTMNGSSAGFLVGVWL